MRYLYDASRGKVIFAINEDRDITVEEAIKLSGGNIDDKFAYIPDQWYELVDLFVVT